MKLKLLFAAFAFSCIAFTSCDKNDEILSATPEAIEAYVVANFPDAKILVIKYDPNDKEYDVKLSNGWELTFDRNYKLTDVES